MKFIHIALAVTVLVIAGVFSFLILADVPVEQSEITKTIPNDKFFESH